jgi:acetoin utilization deacetylase AcuC-like enzyme
MTLLYTDPLFLDHDTGRHPEKADRLRSITARLEKAGLVKKCIAGKYTPLTEDAVAGLHDPKLVQSVKQLAAHGGGHIDGDTVVSAASHKVALAAAGACSAAVDAVLKGDDRTALCLVRPPGHHATPTRAMGFCLFNNIALAAHHARKAHKLTKILIVDWDVHHGNGTQACFYERDDVLTISLHMRHGSWGPSHPETGSPAESGTGRGAGHNVNVELRPGSGDGAYAEAFSRVVEPVVERYRPDVLIGACGQDASAFDGNGRMNVSMDGFHAIGRSVRASAEQAGARLLLVQEGGYARTYAAYCLHATLEGVLGADRLLADPVAYMPDDPAHATADIDAVCAEHRDWGLR